MALMITKNDIDRVYGTPYTPTPKITKSDLDTVYGTPPSYTDIQRNALSYPIKQTKTNTQKYGTVNGKTVLPYSIENQGLYALSPKSNLTYSEEKDKIKNTYTDYLKKQNEKSSLDSYNQNLKNVFIGTFPSTNEINPLQTEKTNVDYRKTLKKEGKLHPTVENTKYQLYDINTSERLFEIDKHPIKQKIRKSNEHVPHINAIKPPKAKPSQKKLATYWDERKVSQEFYDTFRNFDDVIENVKFAGKAIAATGVVLEAVEFVDTVYEDVNDEDGKLGKKFIKVTAGITADWAGGLIGAEIGAMGGASVGTAILAGPGTLIGGFIGGTIGGIIGSIASRNTVENWIEKNYIGD